MTDPLPSVVVTPTGYLAVPVTADADALAAQALIDLAAGMPGWVPRDGHLEVWLTYAMARMAATAAQVAGQASQAIFQHFGQSLLDIPALDGAPATAPSTWTLTDSLGHTIPAGTIIGYATSPTSAQLFEVDQDVTVAPGSNMTGSGEVTLVALTPGVVANGLPAGAVQLFTNLAWVSSVVTTASSAGGLDPETVDAYLGRLRAQLKLLAPRPILPGDFAVLAKTQDGVARATAINLYNPADGTSDNPRMVTVVAVDAEGVGVDAGARTALAALLDGMREVNFVVNVTEPTSTVVTVTAQLVAIAGASTNTVQTACVAALEDLLDPAHWGDSTDSTGAWSWTWTNTTTVRYLDVATALRNVPGVGWVSSLLIGVGGGGQVAADGALPGPAALPSPGAIAVTVT